jgi:AcrR family transcriptional regulator
MTGSKRRTRPLSQEELQREALAIADRHGLAALTMRRLADEVGVEAASLYYHVKNKGALLDGVVRLMRAEMRLPDPLPKDWTEVLVAVFGEYRRVLAAHPNMLPLAGRRVDGEPNIGLVYLVEQGFNRDDAVDLYQAMLAFTVGFSMCSSDAVEVDATGMPPELKERMAEWREAAYTRTLRLILEGFAASRRHGRGALRPG